MLLAEKSFIIYQSRSFKRKLREYEKNLERIRREKKIA